MSSLLIFWILLTLYHFIKLCCMAWNVIGKSIVVFHPWIVRKDSKLQEAITDHRRKLRYQDRTDFVSVSFTNNLSMWMKTLMILPAHTLSLNTTCEIKSENRICLGEISSKFRYEVRWTPWQIKWIVRDCVSIELSSCVRSSIELSKWMALLFLF